MENMHSQPHSPWKKLALMSALSFVSMYALMYMMVDIFANVFNNLNQVYMAGSMTAAMVIIEIMVMGMMYPDKKKRLAVVAGSAVLLILFIMSVRQQLFVGDRQFLKSMIPHHGAAVLMCEQAQINDPEIRALCQQIIQSQQDEIDQMQAKLRE